jgi:hypothetical protein
MLTLITEAGEALNSSSYPVPLTQQVLHEICTTYDYDATTEVFATYIISGGDGEQQYAVAFW